MKILSPLDDSLSFGLSVAALLIIIYLSTFTGFTSSLLIPLALLLGGWVLQLTVAGRIEQDKQIDGEEAGQVLKYTLIALAGIMIGSIAVPGLFTPPTPASLVGGNALLFTILYAISEERFFRGGVNTFLTWKIGAPLTAIAAGALIFGAYHMAVYGQSYEKIAYTIVAGFMFGYATYKTGRLTSAKLGHIGNNVLSLLAKAGGA